MRYSFYFLIMHIGLMLLWLVCILSYVLNYDVCVQYYGYETVVVCIVFNSICFIANGVSAATNIISIKKNQM